MSAPGVVVVGAGVLCEEASDLASFRERIGAQAPRARRVAPDLADRLTPHQARRLDRASQLLLAAAQEAASHAKIDEVDGDRIGLVVGTGFGCLGKTRSQLAGIARSGLSHLDAMGFSDSMDNAPAAHATIALGCRGPSFTLREREISGESAILLGVSLLESGRADAVVVVSGDAADPIGERILGTQAADLVARDAAGAVVLEMASSAARRGAGAMGRIAGRARGTEHVKERALAMAGLAREEVELLPENALEGRIGWCPAAGVLRVILGLLLVERERRPVLVLREARGGASAALVLAPWEPPL